MSEIREEVIEQVTGGYYGPTQSYLIKKGDCLSVIAQRFRTTVAVLLQLNPQITNPDKIYAGQWLTVPAI